MSRSMLITKGFLLANKVLKSKKGSGYQVNEKYKEKQGMPLNLSDEADKINDWNLEGKNLHKTIISQNL